MQLRQRMGRLGISILSVLIFSSLAIFPTAFAATKANAAQVDANGSGAITSSSLRFDANTITIDVVFASLGNPFTDSAWISGQDLLGVDLSFNYSGYADAVIAFGAKNGQVIAVGENQSGNACSASARVAATNTLEITTDANCYGRPGQIADNVLFSNNGAYSAAPNSGLSGVASQPGGYWLLGGDGGVFSFGNAGFYGSTGNIRLNQPVVAMSPSPGNDGYRFTASDGGVFSYGNAPFAGSMGGHPLNQPVVGMATTRSGNGYWLVASDGGLFAFGDAGFYGSMGGQHLNSPIVGMTPTASGHGYWLVASDGGLFAFGDAGFYGSMGGQHLNSPITAMAASSGGGGYYLLAADGGVFAYGDAGFYGSAAGAVSGHAVGIAVESGGGYRITDSSGGVYDYGSTFNFGDLRQMFVTPNSPVVGMAAAG